MCLGYISKAFTVDNIKKIGINGYINEFSVDFNIIDATDTVDIRKYSIKIKYKITFRLIKNVFIGLLSFLEKLGSDHIKCVSLNNQVCQHKL